MILFIQMVNMPIFYILLVCFRIIKIKDMVLNCYHL